MSAYIIKNAMIIDGTGKKAFKSDVLVEDMSIKSVSTHINPAGYKCIDASELILCPGFIDPHGHSDISALAAPECAGKISQGITTEVCGNCGLSSFPVTDKNKEHLEEIYRNYSLKITWSDINGYADELDRRRPTMNIASLCGHNTTRAAVTGYGDVKLKQSDINKMLELLDSSLKDGAAGFSTGLIYIPGKFSDPLEILSFLKTLRPHLKPYTTHLRSEGKILIEAIKEAVSLSLNSHIPRLHISHLKTSGKANWHKIEEALTEITKAQIAGLNVTADRYPYTESMTELGILVPEPYDKLDSVSLENTLKNSAEFESFKKHLDEAYDAAYWGTVRVISTKYEKALPFLGNVISEIASHLKMKPSVLCAEILREDAAGAQAAFQGMNYDNMIKILKQKYVCCCTDETARPLDYSIGRSHPRGWASFPRFINLLKDSMSLEEIIMKMTSLPAEIFSIRDRGIIAPGYKADFVLFDKSQLKDFSDFSNPHVFSGGIKKVWVNGNLTYDNGEISKIRSGSFLKL